MSWPKKASTIETDIAEDIIRELALLLGLVDTRVVQPVMCGLV